MAGKLAWRISGDPSELLRALDEAEKAIDKTARHGGQSWSVESDRITRSLKQSAATVEAGYKGLAAKISGAFKGIQLPGLGGSIGGLASMAGVVAIATKAVAGYEQLAKSTAKLGAESGGSAERISTLLGVLNQLDVPVSSVETAFEKLTEAMNTEKGQRELADLGIAVKDVEGNARPVIDVFDELRDRFAGSKLDAGALQVANDLLGRGYQDLLPLLGLSGSELQALEQQVRDTGGVIDEAGITKAQEFATQLKELELTAQGAGNTFARDVVPIFLGALQAIGQGFDTLGIFATKVLEMVVNQGARAAQALVALFKGDYAGAARLGAAFAGGFKSTGDLLGESVRLAEQHAAAAAARTRATAVAIVNARGGNDHIKPPDDGADQRAIQDRIDAVRKLADEEERRLQKALDGYTRERQAAIEAIQAEENAREKRHNAELREIQDETDATEQSFDKRQRARDDEVSGLQEQIRATQELVDLEKDRRDIADAELALAHERSVTVTREGFRSARDYYAAVQDQNRRVRDAEEKLGDAKTKLARDTARSQIEARIRAIQTESEQERRALEDYKHGAQQRIQAIRDQMAKEKEQADTRVKQIQDEMTKERERTQDAITKLQDETRATIEELQKRLKEHQNTASQIAAAYPNLSRTITYNVVTTGSAPGGGGPLPGDDQNRDRSPDANDRNKAEFIRKAYRTYLGRDPEDEGAVTGRLGMSEGQIVHDIRNSPEGQLFERSHRGGGSAGIHDFPHTIRLGEPTALIGLRSHRSYGVAAAGGAEDVAFGGVGGSRGRAFNFSPTFNIRAETVEEARRAAHEKVDVAFQDLVEAIAAERVRG